MKEPPTTNEASPPKARPEGDREPDVPFPPVDPEDWASTGPSSDEERYLRNRPPHWE